VLSVQNSRYLVLPQRVRPDLPKGRGPRANSLRVDSSRHLLNKVVIVKRPMSPVRQTLFDLTE